jgi:hypothetical protein
MSERALDKIIREGITRGMIGSFSRLSENIGEQLGRELWSDPDFRAQLQTLMREFGREALQTLTNPPPPPNLDDVLTRLDRLEQRSGVLGLLTKKAD